jgi:hypothetical protein
LDEIARRKNKAFDLSASLRSHGTDAYPDERGYERYYRRKKQDSQARVSNKRP